MKNFIIKVKNQDVRKGLIYSVWDGALWAVMFGFADNYLAPFALYFGATALQVSLIAAAGQLGVSFIQIIGAKFIHNYRDRRTLVIRCIKLHAISILFIFYITYLSGNPYFIIIFYFINILVSSFGGPAWISWMNELVPVKLRGEFWGLRNKIMGITQLLAISFAGIMLFLFKKNSHELLSFGILFTLAFIIRYCSIIPVSRQYEPPMALPKEADEFTLKKFLTKLFTTNFGRFVLFSILMTLVVNFMAPIIAVFILKSLKMNYLQFTVLIMAATITTFLSMTYWGPLADKYGNYRILFITAIGLPMLALGWGFIKEFYFLLVIQLLGGFIWGGFTISTTNYIFDSVRRENIHKAMAYFNSLNNLCAFLGSLLGGLSTIFISNIHIAFFSLAENNYEIIFLISFLLRISIILLFIKKFKEVREVETSPPIQYFYIYKPAMDIINQFYEGGFKKGKKII